LQVFGFVVHGFVFLNKGRPPALGGGGEVSSRREPSGGAARRCRAEVLQGRFTQNHTCSITIPIN
jgi:hypothetical protein